MNFLMAALILMKKIHYILRLLAKHFVRLNLGIRPQLPFYKKYLVYIIKLIYYLKKYIYINIIYISLISNIF